MASANNAKKGANVRMKRKERKNIAAGQAHIQSTFNNTVVTITDLQGNAVSWCSLWLPELPRQPQEHSVCSTVCSRDRCQGRYRAWHEDR